MGKLETKVDFALCGAAEMAALVRHASPRDLQGWASHLTLDQARIAIHALASPQEAQNGEKLHAIIQGLTQVESLEVVGRAVDLSQLHQLLSFPLGDNAHLWKLFPLFVAIPQGLFNQLLLDIPQNQKCQLQKLCSSEPIQHHLLLFSNGLKQYFESYITQLQELQTEISELNVDELTPESLANAHSKLESFRNHVLGVCHQIENALALGWNADNAPLIESLSSYREKYEKFLYVSVGHPKGNSEKPTGIFHLFEEHLNKVFGENSRGKETLDDSDAGVEALASLGIWYPQDYWDIGLLPKADGAQELSLESQNISAQAAYRKLAEHNLAALGLKSVKDFKKHNLVSRALVRGFIAAHRFTQ